MLYKKSPNWCGNQINDFNRFEPYQNKDMKNNNKNYTIIVVHEKIEKYGDTYINQKCKYAHEAFYSVIAS